jgi:hypothetical protein
VITPEHCVAFVVTEGELPYHFGERLKYSFLYFNPDVKFIHFTHDNLAQYVVDMDQWLPQPIESNWINYIRPQIVNSLLRQYQVVLMLDADVMVCAHLAPVWMDDYDVAGSLNAERFPGDRFLNIGVTAFRSQKFADCWASMAANSQDLLIYNNEQETFNILLGTHQQTWDDPRCGQNFNLKVLDAKKTKENWNERYRGWLQDAIVNGDELWATNGRRFMTIHHAGGCSFKDRLSSKAFPSYLKRYFNRICGVDDFTRYEGADYHYFKHKWEWK